jgi:hypothetical protein
MLCRARSSSEEQRVSRKIDCALAILFVVLFIGWLGSDGGATFGLIDRSTGWYANEVDPIFRNPPSWLVTSGWFGFAFGPLYALAAYGLFRKSPWVCYVVLPLVGMAVVANGIYLIEDLSGDVPPINLTWFYILNVPYTLVPILAAIWVVVQQVRTNGSTPRSERAAKTPPSTAST